VYTIDASAYARDFDVRDSEHMTCRALFARLAADATPVIVPLLLLAEIAAAVSRERRDPIAARLTVDAIRAQPHVQLVPLDDALAQEAAELAADYALRGADAIYVAVARRYGCTLISLDREQLERPAGNHTNACAGARRAHPALALTNAIGWRQSPRF
jgi:predicted nucleic acid-binding protein